MLVRSIRAKELITLLPKFDCKGIEVQSVTCDLSQSYDWFCRQVFYNSLHVADKFHIIKQLLDACQDVRVRYRQELLTDKRLKYEAFTKQEHTRKQELKQWHLDIEKDAVMEMENFKSLVERNEGIILNYFVKGDTNAFAEFVNGKIQRFIAANQDTRDTEFFYFRLAKHFSST